MIWFEPSAAEEAHADALEKYGMPPDVPATVRANVPLVVIGDPETEIRPPVKVLVPASSHFPVPILVTLAVPVAIAPVIVLVPVPDPSSVRLYAPLTEFAMVRLVLESLIND
jgi:hypothetical protein